MIGVPRSRARQEAVRTSRFLTGAAPMENVVAVLQRLGVVQTAKIGLASNQI